MVLWLSPCSPIFCPVFRHAPSFRFFQKEKFVIARLNPEFEISGRSYTMATQFIGVVALSELGPDLIDLTGKAEAVTAVKDFLFQGF